MNKVLVLETSLRCYVYGWLSFLPVLGIPFVVLALIDYQRARLEAGGEWNAANRYLHCGLALAALGGFVSLVAFALMLKVVLMEAE
ncbi:MAG: hypothetical protein AB1705_09425 [Verrucomicrobiota bacterium]